MMGRSPEFCPHNVVDEEDGETYCVECGSVVDDDVIDESNLGL